MDFEASGSPPSTLYLVERLELGIRAVLDDALRPHGLTTTQYTALTALAHRDGLSSAQLAAAAALREGGRAPGRRRAFAGRGRVVRVCVGVPRHTTVCPIFYVR